MGASSDIFSSIQPCEGASKYVVYKAVVRLQFVSSRVGRLREVLVIVTNGLKYQENTNLMAAILCGSECPGF